MSLERLDPPAGKAGVVRLPGIRHEAWVYEGRSDFLTGAGSFVREGLARGQAVMVATTRANLRGLERELGAEAAAVELVDMSVVGRNPGRIISLWRQFADGAASRGRGARGIGEPVWAGRTPAELDECCRHEALINSAFAEPADFWLLCPYDRSRLDERALEAMARTHPYVRNGDGAYPSERFEPSLGHEALEGELPPAPAGASRFRFDRDRLAELRAFVRAGAWTAGLDGGRSADLVIAVSELAGNAIRHGGGSGEVAIWRDGALLCDVDTAGRIADPLVGRAKPASDQTDGRGLWIVHELCDLVQIRSSERGIRVRLTLRAR